MWTGQISRIRISPQHSGLLNQLWRLLTGAQAVIFFYAAEAECFWRMYAGALDVSRIHVIPNGFDWAEASVVGLPPPVIATFRTLPSPVVQ